MLADLLIAVSFLGNIFIRFYDSFKVEGEGEVLGSLILCRANKSTLRVCLFVKNPVKDSVNILGIVVKVETLSDLLF